MLTHRQRTPLLVLAAVATALIAAGCGGGIDDTLTPSLVFEPGTVQFDAVQVQQSDIQELRIRNAGDGRLTISEMTPSPSNFEVVSVTYGGQDQNPQSFAVEPNEVAVVSLRYTNDDENNAGGLRIRHNDPNVGSEGVSIVPLAAVASSQRLYVNPNPVGFGRVPAGESRNVTATITNIGSTEVTVTDYFIVGAAELTLAAEDAFTEPFTLGPDEDHTVTINYLTVDAEQDTADFIVKSTAGDLTVPVNGNGAQPCIEVVPGGIDGQYDFGERLLNQSNREPFTIRNCSSAGDGEPLVVSNVVLGADSSATFSLDSVPNMPATLAPGETRDFLVAFEPTVEFQAEEATLLISSNDELTPELTIDLYGVGSNNVPPTAAGVCTLEGSGGPGLSQLFVIPLETITCSASDSDDPDGEIVEYIWTVEEAPPGSSSNFEPPNTENTRFFVDIAGDYIFHLVVIDDRGAASQPALIQLSARPDEDIHLQLTWTTPGDPNQEDTDGADLDLHMLHPNGCWEDELWDCHYSSKSPNWGNTTSLDDDPSLDIDDLDGLGPENINLDNPQQDLTYQVAVHYYDDHGWGPALATVRIYVHGTLHFESRDKRMVSTGRADGQWWLVAGLHWPSTEIDHIDRIYEDVPPCTP